MKNEPCPFFPEWPLKSEHLANNNNGKKGETTNGRPIAKKEKGRQRNSTRRWLAKCRDGWVLLFRPGYRPWLSLGRQTRRPHDQWDQWRINGLFIGSRCLVVFLFFLRDRFRLSLAAFLLYRPLPVLRPSFYMFFCLKWTLSVTWDLIRLQNNQKNIWLRPSARITISPKIFWWRMMLYEYTVYAILTEKQS